VWFLLSGLHFCAGVPLAVSVIAPAGTFGEGSGLGDYQFLFGSLANVPGRQAAALSSIPSVQSPSLNPMDRESAYYDGPEPTL
jgi:hypothetical protein